MNNHKLTTQQQTMVDIWERHTTAEFEEKSIDSTMATMTFDPVVNHVPVMTGGVGTSEVRHFYSIHFIPGHPPDTDVVPVTRTVGDSRIVDELIHKIASERIYWDQASVLVQIGLINAKRLPVTGAEASRKVLDPTREASNRLIRRVNP